MLQRNITIALKPTIELFSKQNQISCFVLFFYYSWQNSSMCSTLYVTEKSELWCSSEVSSMNKWLLTGAAPVSRCVYSYGGCRALQFPPEGWLRMGLNNGSITWLTIRPSGRVALRALGDSGFMPPDKLTRTWRPPTRSWPQVQNSPFFPPEVSWKSICNQAGII